MSASKFVTERFFRHGQWPALPKKQTQDDPLIEMYIEAIDGKFLYTIVMDRAFPGFSGFGGGVQGWADSIPEAYQKMQGHFTELAREQGQRDGNS